MKIHNIDVVKKTFQEIADLVTPTMGAKGRMAVIEDEFGRPTLTDDGVTVAKQCNNFTGAKRMVALSMTEAANNTEKEAFDGTTLTILLVNEIYREGLRWIRRGLHPQTAADLMQTQIHQAQGYLKSMAIPLKEYKVEQLAFNITKIDEVARLVSQAYEQSNHTMNVLIEHDRVGTTSVVEHTDGMIIDSGYFSDSLRKLCNDGDKTKFSGARIAILSEAFMTRSGISAFFGSLPMDREIPPLVFAVSNGFDPDAMKTLIETLVDNKLIFQFFFINDERQTELFEDIAAYTNATPLDSMKGSRQFMFDDMGYLDTVVIEDNKTILTNSKPNRAWLDARLAMYRKELAEMKFNTSMSRQATLTHRLSNLESGVTKIKIAAPTVTEFVTIKLKLDDAIGGVRCAIKSGILLGAGKALYKVGESVPKIRKVLQKPAHTILANAGLKMTQRMKDDPELGIDVRKRKHVRLYDSGIVDSYDSIAAALKNAASIAIAYLRAFVLIQKADQ